MMLGQTRQLLGRRSRRLLLAGRRYECICGRTWRRFEPFNGRPNANCPACQAKERHRLLWLFLERERMLASGAAVLHFAAEPAISSRLRARTEIRYATADLLDPAADHRADMTDLQMFSDACFDLVIVSHVLEHISDDAAALRELHRVLRPDGILLLQHPIDERRDQTDEDESVSDPAGRLRRFGQDDHVRVYGRDFAARVRAAGFSVTRRRYVDEADPALIERFQARTPTTNGIVGDDIYVCRRS